MKFTMQSSVLRNQVKLAERFVPERTRNKALQNVLVYLTPSGGAITANDGSMSFSRTFEIDAGRGEVAFLLKPKLIEGIAKECPGQLNFTVDEDHNVIITHSELAMETEFKLITEDVTQFPPMVDAFKIGVTAKLNRAEFIEAAKWCLPSLEGSQFDKGELGLAIRKDKTGAMIGTTNGSVLTTYGGISGKVKKPLLLSREFTVRLLDVVVTVDDEWFELRAEKETLFATGKQWTLGGEIGKVFFPDVAWTMICKERTHYVTCEAAAFKKAFQQAAVVIKGDKSKRVTLEVTPAGIIFSAPLEGSTEDFIKSVPCPTAGGSTRITVIPKQITQWLSRIGKSQWVGFACSDVHSPTVFLCSEHKTANFTVSGMKKEKVPAVEPVEVQEAAAAAS